MFPLRRRLPPELLAGFRIDDPPAVRAYLAGSEYRELTSRWPTLLPWDAHAD